MTKPLSLLLAMALVVATASLVRAQDDDDTPSLDDTPHITIVGSATTEMPPDIATITLGVTSHKPTAKAAADATSIAAQAIVDEAKAEGVKPADIATQTLSLTQTFEDEQDAAGHFARRKPTGFDASNNVAIRVRDLDKAGTLAQGLIDKGANTFDGIAFAIEHPQPVLDKLAAEAVVNARRQAEMVAQSAGVKLGRVLLIERAGAAPVSRPYAAPMASMARIAAKVPVEAGSESLMAEMKVTWAIDQP